MATIKELKAIFDATPIEQPILLEGKHGIGKSEIIKQIFEEQGYRVVVRMLGQASDGGDVIGLPTRKTIKVNGKDIEVMIFAPPSWWPLDENEKVVLFLDELNRAKPDIHNVIMDLVLNRKLGELKLSKNCRIVSAINPLDTGNYQVEELDPALLDRFNKYDFNPRVEEWIDWATKSKINRHVIGFISRFQNLLDVPNEKEMTSGKVYQSRRSWERVSNIMNANPTLPSDVLNTMLLGIIGESCTSAFAKYLRENDKGIAAATIITQFHKRVEEIELKLSTMNVQDVIGMNGEIVMWFNENTNLLKDEGLSKETRAQYTYNLQRYLDVIPTEAMAEFFHRFSEENKSKPWPKLVSSLNRQIAQKMIDVFKGVAHKK